jgi:hypothetical protein
LAEIRVLRVLDDADDVHRSRRRRSARFITAEANTLSNRHCATEELPGERGIDDRDVRRLRPIVLGEDAAMQDGDPHDVEIRRCDDVGERPQRPAVR